MSASFRPLSLPALALFLFVLDPVSGGAQEATSQGVHATGTVRERETRSPVEGAVVTITDSESSTGSYGAETNQGGVFDLGDVLPGSYVIRVSRLGYTVLVDTIDIAAGPVAELSVLLTPEAIDLPPILVSVNQTVDPVLVGFQERRARGLGTFLSREDIERRNPTRISDVFRTIPSVHVSPATATGGGLLTMRGGCLPGLVIDGAPVSPALSLDQMMTPENVEAIEVYGMSSAPIEYAQSQCGTIVMWTRVARRAESRGRPWRLLGFISGLIGLTIILR